jgi:hypothetical protein
MFIRTANGVVLVQDDEWATPQTPSPPSFVLSIPASTDVNEPPEPEVNQDAGAPTWTVTSWIVSLNLMSALGNALLEYRIKDGTHVADVDLIKSLTNDEIDAAVDAASQHLKTRLKQGINELRAEDEVDALKLNKKFAADADSFEFEYGSISDYHGGLESLIGHPSPNFAERMEWEHMDSEYASKEFAADGSLTTAGKEYHYITKEQQRNTGPGQHPYVGWVLQTFLDMNASLIQEAGLQICEVIALRLYTGPMYKWYNNVLRFRKDAYMAIRAPFDDYKEERTAIPFQTTLHIINSAIIKLSRTQIAHKVYRGVSGGVLPQEFWTHNKHNVRGGIDMAFMSTTLDRDVAKNIFAAAVDGKCSMLFEVQMGMIDRGAPVKWCSQYPKEEEILFAPLTGLEVVGTPRVENKTIVVELRLNCNMHDRTIEQVIEAAQNQGDDYSTADDPQYTLTSYASSNFKRECEWLATKPLEPSQVGRLLEATRRLIDGYCTLKGIDKARGDAFFSELRREWKVDDVVARAAQRLWNSCIEMSTGTGNDDTLEFCSVFSRLLQADSASLARSCAIVARALNSNLLAGSTSDAFPQNGQCWRGGGFDEQHRGFFTVGKKYRVPGFLSTSGQKSESKIFMYKAECAGYPVVQWIQLDRRSDPQGENSMQHRCKHVNTFSTLQDYGGGEEEATVFAAFSVFTVREAVWSTNPTTQDPHRITIEAAIDNALEPEDLPLAPWC